MDAADTGAKGHVGVGYGQTIVVVGVEVEVEVGITIGHLAAVVEGILGIEDA